jgi:hypothetical protein
MTITDDQLIAMFNSRLDYAKRFVIGMLPQWDMTKPCPNCNPAEDDAAWSLEEYGYTRSSNVDVLVNETTGKLYPHGTTNGWDDYSEGGYLEYIRCRHCDATFRLPDGVLIQDWD